MLVVPFILILGVLQLKFVVGQMNNPICRGQRYYCQNNTNMNQPNVCVNISDFRGKEHQLQPCPSTKYSYCPYWQAKFGSPAVCTIPPASNLSLPGDTCRFDGQCQSGNCPSGVCVGLPLNTSCSWHADCDTGLFCNASNMCETQRLFGSVTQILSLFT